MDASPSKNNAVSYLLTVNDDLGNGYQGRSLERIERDIRSAGDPIGGGVAAAFHGIQRRSE